VHYDAGWRPGAPPGGGMPGRGKTRGSLEELIAGNRRLGIDPAADAPRARWKWESQIPDDVLERAREALL
ncbi:MAG: hypothetical protein R3195_05690, partial [Gemmatimonadota bacterium]|nr:hypothetical protein [Gemmatimonadota bacterium]